MIKCNEDGLTSIVTAVGGSQGSSWGVVGVTALSHRLCSPVAEELARLQAGVAFHQSRPRAGPPPRRGLEDVLRAST